MPSIRKALALSFASKYTDLAISIVSVMIIARLLTPAEIGVYSVGMAVAALAHVLRDFGVGNYLIQEKELTQDRVRTALGVAIVIAWTMAAVLFAASGAIARFYDEPGLRDLLIVLSATFLVIPFGSPILALLRRDMAFGKLYVIDIANALVHATTVITLATLGFGFMSLAWASLAAAVTTAAAATIYSPRIARTLPSFKEWRRVAKFGSLSSAADVIGQIGMATPDLILGRMLGFTAVGLFSRAYGIIQIFNRMVMHAVMPVMTPVFAARNRAGEELLEPYLKGLSYVTVLAWPFFIFLGLMAYPIIRILFGDQWDDAVPLVQILCLAGIIRSLYYFAPPLFIALGEIKINLKVTAVNTATFVLLFSLGALHSLEIAAIAPAVSCFVYFAISYLYLRDLVGLLLRNIVNSISKSLVVSLFSAIIPGAVFFGMDIGPKNLWLPLLVALSGTAIIWTGATFVTKHPIREELTALYRHACLASKL